MLHFGLRAQMHLHHQAAQVEPEPSCTCKHLQSWPISSSSNSTRIGKSADSPLAVATS